MILFLLCIQGLFSVSKDDFMWSWDAFEQLGGSFGVPMGYLGSPLAGHRLFVLEVFWPLLAILGI